MIQWTLYDDSTNPARIIRTGEAPTMEQAQLQATGGGRIVMVGSDPAIQAIDPNPGGDPVLINRQSMNLTVNKTTITANGVDGIAITGIPNGAKYDIYLPPDMGLVQPPDGIVTDGALVVTTTVPGIYSIRISFQNYLDYKVSFNAS